MTQAQHHRRHHQLMPLARPRGLEASGGNQQLIAAEDAEMKDAGSNGDGEGGSGSEQHKTSHSNEVRPTVGKSWIARTRTRRRATFNQKVTLTAASRGALLHSERVQRARTILEPFIHQRKKEQVLKDLPPKTTKAGEVAELVACGTRVTVHGSSQQPRALKV
ncbi:hypothetical protein B0T17DRAFT_509156 [Bombardia bombarda]|uniref:Uncharacterized protein n=1 Tax=Bombardia bombarda TaxID=252184 RepID=A0AA40C1S4_9PEZI|nr:hypothetical protein B0T17DRAFT_509156 [Bombardia bombarda]